MKKSIVLGLIVTLSGCEIINVGNVGLKINTAGSARGLENTPTVSGYVTYNPFTQDVKEISTIIQTVAWTKGEPDESISFGSVEGLSVNADISLSFHVDPTTAAKFYSAYRTEDLEAFAHGPLRNQVKDGLNELGSVMPVTEIYGKGKSVLLLNLGKFLAERLKPKGVVIDQVTFNSHLRLPENIQQAINNSIEQSQRAETARNKIALIEAEANQKIAEVRGVSEAKKSAADAEAYSTLARAESQAKADLLLAEALASSNKLLQASITKELIDYKKAEKWDGKLVPSFGAGANMMLDLRSLDPK